MKNDNYELNRNLITVIIIAALMIVSLFLYCRAAPVFVQKKESEAGQTAKSTIVVDYPIHKETKENEINKFTGRRQVVMHKVGVPMLLQNPKLPTGCEVMSLTMVLQYYGFDVNEDLLVDEYLRYWSSDYPVGFRGDPRSDDGGMMWPPALVDTANDYLSTQDTDRHAYDVSDLDFSELIKYIDDNIPIIIWVNETFSDRLNFDEVICYYEGREYHSHYGSHCVVITGYDDTNNKIIINDPLIGESSIEKFQLWAVYDVCGQNAIIIS